jgi:hypothetical protein
MLQSRWVDSVTTRSQRSRERVRQESSKGHFQRQRQFDRKTGTGTTPKTKGQRCGLTETGVKGWESSLIILCTTVPIPMLFRIDTQ